MGMGTRGTSAVAILVAAILSTAAVNAAPLPGFTLTAETKHFSYYTRDGLKVDVARNERFLSEIEKLLRVQVPGRAEYYRVRHPEEVAFYTGLHAAGVTNVPAARIHTTLDHHAHEIVHWVAGQLGDPGAFFQEGLALALVPEGRWKPKAVKARAREALEAQTLGHVVRNFALVDPEVSYPVAGSFVAFLIRTEGLARVVELFRAGGRDAAVRDAAFKRVFGRSLEEAAAAWQVTL